MGPGRGRAVWEAESDEGSVLNLLIDGGVSSWGELSPTNRPGPRGFAAGGGLFSGVMSRKEVLPGRYSSILRIRTSFLAGSPSLPPARKLVLILKLLLFLPGNTSCLMMSNAAAHPQIHPTCSSQ